MKFRAFVLAFFLAILNILIATHPAYAIIGGTAVPTDEGSDPLTQSKYSWAGYLMPTASEVDISCGITIIGARFALTGAHCVDGQSTDNMYIRAGGYDRTDGEQTGQLIKVSAYIKSPLYDPVTTSGDFAILILEENAVLAKTPIYITQVEIGDNRTATVIGWGSTDVAGASGPFGVNSSILREAQVKTVSRAECEAALNGNAAGYVVDATTFCAGVATGEQDTCTGDSGGPIFVMGEDGKPVQIGITSWGIGCGLAGYPGVYANISSLLGLILDTLGDQSAINLIDYALTNDQAQVANILDRLGNASIAGTTLRHDYGRLFLNGVAGTSNALQSLLPSSAHAITAMVSSFVSIQGSSIMSHIRNLHQGLAGGSLDMNGLRFTSASSAGSVDRSTGLSVPNTMYGSNGSYEPNASDYRTGGRVDLTQIDRPADTGTGQMYRPSLYSDNGDGSRQVSSTNRPTSLTNVPASAAPITGSRRMGYVAPSSGNNADISAIGYDSDGNPVRPVAIRKGGYYTSQNGYQARPINETGATTHESREASGFMGWFTRLFGGGSTSEVTRTTEQGSALPRTAAMTRRDQAYLRASRYPGQPLGAYYARQQTAPDDGSVYGYNPSAVTPPPPPSYRTAGNTVSNTVDEVEVDAAPVETVSRQTTTLRRPMIKNYAKIVDSSGVGFPSTALDMNNEQADAMPIGYGAKAPTPVNADRRWGLFMSGDVRFGREQLLRHSMATTVGNTGFTVGADYRIADKSFVGLAMTYAHGSFTTGNYSDVQGDGYALSLYGTTNYLTNAYVDGFVSVGLHRFDSERTLFIGNGQKIYANAAPRAMNVAAQVETGYDHVVNDWHMGPFLGFKLMYASFDGYSESNASSFNLRVYDRKDLSAIGSLGAGVSRRYNMNSIGGVWAPGVRMAYNHEFGRGYSDVKSHFLIDPMQQTFVTEGAHRERDWLSINPTVTAALANNWMFQAYYEHDFFRYNENNHVFNLSARYKW